MKMKLIKQDLHAIIITTNRDSTPVEKGPASGSSYTILVPDPPRIGTSISENRSSRLELMNKAKPIIKEILHILLAFTFCAI